MQIRHQIRGRIRLHVADLYRNPRLARRLEQRLGGVEGIRRVRTNPLSASLVVHYDPKRPVPTQLHRHISDLVGERPVPRPGFSAPAAAVAGMVAALPGLEFGLQPGAECAACEPKKAEEQGKYYWAERIGTFIALTGFLGYQLVRDHVYKNPLSESPLSLTGIVSLVSAVPLLREAWRETFHERRFTIHQFLAFSLLLGIFMGEAGTAFEIIYVLRGGMLLEEYVANRSRRAIHQMLEISVKEARILQDGTEQPVPLEALQQGDLVVVRTGEKIPVDGDIAWGEALLDESSITGRADPEFKEIGDKVFAGSYLEKGVIHVNALKVGGDTYLAHVARLVDASLEQQSPLEQRADQLAARLLKLGTLLTVGTLAVTRDFQRAFTVMLVMSCPCATILAASTAVSAALYNAARRQILVKGGVFLEQIGAAEVYCFDKTGTITTGEPVVAGVVAENERELIHWAASAEQHNPHILAVAILNRAKELGIEPEQHSISEHVLGQGIKARVGDSDVLLGNRKMLEGAGIDPAPYADAAKGLIIQGRTAVYVARDGRLLGVIGISHRQRPGSREVLERLRATGVERIHLISGDEAPVALALSNELGMDSCHADLLPEEKARVVTELRLEDGTLVMVGDGVNDAPALSEADIGIAMGAGGSEVAIEVADIALADDDMTKLIYLRELSGATLRVAEQNYQLAVITNLAGVALGAIGWLTPAMGGLIHIAHTLGILLNSSRLLVFDSEPVVLDEADT